MFRRSINGNLQPFQYQNKNFGPTITAENGDIIKNNGGEADLLREDRKVEERQILDAASISTPSDTTSGICDNSSPITIPTSSENAERKLAAMMTLQSTDSVPTIALKHWQKHAVNGFYRAETTENPNDKPCNGVTVASNKGDCTNYTGRCNKPSNYRDSILDPLEQETWLDHEMQPTDSELESIYKGRHKLADSFDKHNSKFLGDPDNPNGYNKNSFEQTQSPLRRDTSFTAESTSSDYDTTIEEEPSSHRANDLIINETSRQYTTMKESSPVKRFSLSSTLNSARISDLLKQMNKSELVEAMETLKTIYSQKYGTDCCKLGNASSADDRTRDMVDSSQPRSLASEAITTTSSLDRHINENGLLLNTNEIKSSTPQREFCLEIECIKRRLSQLTDEQCRIRRLISKRSRDPSDFRMFNRIDNHDDDDEDTHSLNSSFEDQSSTTNAGIYCPGSSFNGVLNHYSKRSVSTASSDLGSNSSQRDTAMFIPLDSNSPDMAANENSKLKQKERLISRQLQRRENLLHRRIQRVTDRRFVDEELRLQEQYQERLKAEQKLRRNIILQSHQEEKDDAAAGVGPDSKQFECIDENSSNFLCKVKMQNNQKASSSALNRKQQSYLNNGSSISSGHSSLALNKPATSKHSEFSFPYMESSFGNRNSALARLSSGGYSNLEEGSTTRLNRTPSDYKSSSSNAVRSRSRFMAPTTCSQKRMNRAASLMSGLNKLTHQRQQSISNLTMVRDGTSLTNLLGPSTPSPPLLQYQNSTVPPISSRQIRASSKTGELSTINKANSHLRRLMMNGDHLKRCSLDGFTASSAKLTGSSMSLSGNRISTGGTSGSKTNRNYMINAITHVSLAGQANRKQREAVLQEIDASNSRHFMILFRDHRLLYRALYTYSTDATSVDKIHGIGPLSVDETMIEKFYKYNSGNRSFTFIPAKRFSIQCDAFLIQDEYWHRRRTNSVIRR